MTERIERSATDGVEPPDDDARSISKSLIKGLAILSCFSVERPVLGISELADQLGASRSTTHRYACTLVELGYLEQDAKRRYRLGLRAADIGMSALYSMGLRQRALPHMQQLRAETSLTVSLAVLDGLNTVCIERLRGYRSGPRELELGLGSGSRLAAHCSAHGKLLLALRDAAEQRRALREIRLSKRAPGTITSKQRLRAELEEIRRTQLALEDEELARGVRSLAAPVYDAQGEVVAALGLSAASERWSCRELLDRFAAPLQAAAVQISAQAQRGEPTPAVRRRRPVRRSTRRR